MTPQRFATGRFGGVARLPGHQVGRMISNMFGGGSVQEMLDSAPLRLSNLYYSAIPVRGDVTPSFTRATTKNIKNNDGYQVTLLAGELGFPGARRVRNLLNGSTHTFTGGGWNVATGPMTVSAPGVAAPDDTLTACTITAAGANAYLYNPCTGTISAGNTGLGHIWIRRRTGTGTVSLLRPDNTLIDITGTLTTSWAQFSAARTVSIGNCYIGVVIATSGDAVDVWHPQVEDVTAQTTQTAGEYVSVGALDYRNDIDPLYLSLPGTAGHYASTPDSVAASITGDIDIRCKVALTDWTPAALATLVAKYSGALQNSYWFYVAASGALVFQVSPDGSSANAATSSASVPFTDGTTGYVRVTRAAATGKVNFYTSTDGLVWALLGVEQSSSVGGNFDGNSTVGIGQTGGGSFQLSGRIYRAQIYNTIGGTTPVVDFNPHRDAVTPTGTITSSTTGEVWTLNGASSVIRSAAYHGSMVDGVKCSPNDLSGNRLTGMTTPLIELASTNRCKYSEDFTNAAWVSGGGGIAVTPNTAVAPDGTTTADTLTASGANGTLIQDLGVVASAAKSGGLYLKRKTGTGNVDITMDGGATWTTQTINSATWTRCKKSQTLADEDFGIRIVTSGDEVYAAKAMVATEAELTSYIANLAGSTTARNADQFYYSGALIGTLKSLATVDFKRDSGFVNVGLIACLSDGTANNYVGPYPYNASDPTAVRVDVVAGGVSQAAIVASNPYTPGTLSSIATSFATNDIKMAKDGVAQTPDTVATIPTVNRLEYGMVAGAYQLNGYPGIPYGWVRQLSQSELGAVTA